MNTKTNKIPLTLLQFQSFLFLIFLIHGVLSQSLEEQEQTVLLKLKQHWRNLPFMSEWTPSNNSHCSWPGITCTSDSVTELSLYDVNITGPVPPFICDLKNLTVIDLGDNHIPGEFPRALFNCSKLEHLDLSGNYFVGRLPDDIDKLVRLQNLGLGSNNFTGDIPPAIGKLKELWFLDLGGNKFNGSLPPEIGNLSNLENLRLPYNGQLKNYSMPSSYTKLRKLKTLWIYRSNLIGEIPESIGELEALEWLDLSQNDLHGKIPDRLFTLKNLSVVYLYRNKLSGEIPQVVEALKLNTIDLSENNLTGRMPEDFGKLTNLTYLALFSNQLSGTIPEMLCSNLWLLDISDNSYSGSFPDMLGHNIWLLDISNNKFSGKIPTSVSSWRNLKVLWASNNLLTGNIPLELFTLSRLTEVLLNENQLTGNLPSHVESVKSLYSLNLRMNQLTGQVPEKLGLLPVLANLDLSENQFSGQIPSQLGTLALSSLNLSSNNFTGAVPREFENAACTNSFLNNPSLCASNGVLKKKLCNPKSQDQKKFSTLHLALIISACVAVLLLALSFVFFVLVRHHPRGTREVVFEWKLTTFQRLNFTESNILTSLSDHNLIGSGGSGIVYRVPVNDQGNIVAVKRIWNNRKVENRLEQEFLSEVKILSSIQHANIVKLLCCISSESSKILVYEYLENLSLDRWLHNKSRQTTVSAPHSTDRIVLDWPKRLKIAVGAARGLCYMHHDCLPAVIHRDIKSSCK